MSIIRTKVGTQHLQISHSIKEQRIRLKMGASGCQQMDFHEDDNEELIAALQEIIEGIKSFQIGAVLCDEDIDGPKKVADISVPGTEITQIDITNVASALATSSLISDQMTKLEPDVRDGIYVIQRRLPEWGIGLANNVLTEQRERAKKEFLPELADLAIDKAKHEIKSK